MISELDRKENVDSENFSFDDWKKEVLKTVNIAMMESYELKKKAETEEQKKLAMNIQCAIDNVIDFLV